MKAVNGLLCILGNMVHEGKTAMEMDYNYFLGWSGTSMVS